MLFATGDLWDYLPSHAIVIPTNLGWTSSGSNVMGAGVAKQAAQRFGWLAGWYGAACKGDFHRHGNESVVRSICKGDGNWLILLPVKPLNTERPYLSWQGPATLDLVERSVRQLAVHKPQEWGGKKVALPLVGCGNGRLPRAAVLPILEHWLDDRFVLVEQKGAHNE